MRALVVSSFVLPHAGGVEQFVATLGSMLEAQDWEVRVLACRRPGEDAGADAVVPARFVGRSGWPVPTGGWATIRREVGRADVVIANNALHVLPDIAVLAAHRRAVPRLLVIHGSGQQRPHDPSARDAARDAFQRTLGRAVARRSLLVSVSRAGVDGMRRIHGVECAYLPYPLPELPAAVVVPVSGDTLRIAWVGRLASEKDPRLAVAAVDRVRAACPVTLDVYGDGMLQSELAALAGTRPWLTLHGARPWPEVLAAQERSHLCLSTSVWDNAQVAVLEALARGIPVVSTRVGDAPRYYREPGLERFCVEPGDADALAGAIEVLAGSYDAHRRAFAENGERLRAIHGEAPRILSELIAAAQHGRSHR